MASILTQLNDRFAQALKGQFAPEISLPTPLVVTASNPKFGDFQCNIALPLAKQLSQQPMAIAMEIVDKVDLTGICAPPTIAGPGFINLHLLPDYLSEQLIKLQQDEQLGVPQVQTQGRVVVDFSSPNIAKEMHVGHLRSTIIGDCLARVLEFRGYDVLRLNHVGDWGTQFGMLITYLKEVYPEALVTADALDIGDLVTFYKQAKQRFDQDDQFRETSRQAVVSLQAGEEESIKAWQLLCEQSRREFQQIYDWLDIAIEERGESFYNSFLPGVVTLLQEKGLLVEDNGAQCVFLDGFTNKDGDRLPLIVQKSDGGYNYATTDLAALNYRLNTDGAEKIIYVTDAGQANHFAQFFQVAKKAGILTDPSQVVHVPFGLVKGEDGKKLKTRAGDTIRLKDLLKEAVARARQDLETRLTAEERQETFEFKEEVAQRVGIGAVKYADLSQNRTSDYVFSFDKMLALQGNTAPYMLYAYARIQSISREGNIDFAQMDSGEIMLTEPTELVLAKSLLQFADVIETVETSLLPNRLCDYLYELSKVFNRFYENCPVLKAGEPQRSSRLLLCDLTARTLKLGLSLLGIPVLDRM
ncbi:MULTISPECIES: arginine--tRNA ligase [unclassified Synechocystis]|uniref:arginine--tRNA ligase n=1 Tax=unclassified Synechocystis TaxID=2640012 RepID=UPI00041B76B1|nr:MULTISPECIES: arginine--tRNA ligase [unclassified Synechocystis]AIE74115.1 Arginyl-tRNA synthetase [Synechocystis sp. PCC 6714]MCT0252759.1 arginine--tRNA ligase [Synechocystis sp. CS-94]